MPDQQQPTAAPPLSEIELAALVGVALALKRRQAAGHNTAALPPSPWRIQGRREQQASRAREAR